MSTETRNSHREEGSVYVLGLLVLLILTVVGLSLSLWVNERLSHQACRWGRTFHVRHQSLR